MSDSLKNDSTKRQTRRDLHTKSFQNPFFKEKKSFFDRIPWNFLNGVSFFLICIFGAYIIFISPWFRLKSIDLSGVDSALVPAVHAVLTERFYIRRFDLFSEDNVFLYDLAKARHAVSEVIGGTAVDISISKGIIRVSLYQGDGVIRLSSQTYGTFWINREGIVLKKIQEDTPVVIFLPDGSLHTSFVIDSHRVEPLVRTIYEQPIKIGQKIIDDSIIKWILSLNKELTGSMALVVKSYLIEDEDFRHVRVEMDRGWLLYVALPQTEDELTSLSNRLKFIINDKFSGRLEMINSIDLRYDEKIFYF